jgi:hypothetical protein
MPDGRLAVTLMSLALLTVNGVPVNATRGSFVPKPFPLMMICVPKEFSLTLWMIGNSVSCAFAKAVQASSNATRKERRRIMVCLLGRRHVVSRRPNQVCVFVGSITD